MKKSGLCVLNDPTSLTRLTDGSYLLTEGNGGRVRICAARVGRFHAPIRKTNRTT
jgi:hypothetical protein